MYKNIIGKSKSSIILNEKFISMIIIENIIIVDANAWMIKYFSDDSLEYGEFSFSIRGIKDNKLISIPNHIMYQEYEDIVIIDPRIRDLKNINL